MHQRWLAFIPLFAVALFFLSRLPAPGLAEEAPGRGAGIPEWTMVYGGFRHLDDLVALPDGTAWAVDRLVAGTQRQSVFVRWEDGIWRVTQLEVDSQLAAIDFAPPETGFAVGEAGALFAWNGRYWQRQPAPVGRDLRDVSLAGPEEGWAAGDYGTLLRWDGRSWSAAELPYPLSIYHYTAVVAQPGGEAWASALSGEILRYREDAWQVEETPPIARPVDIALRGADQALVVGGGALEWRDGAWHSVGVPGTSYRSAAWVGDSAYAVANDRLVRYQDGSWSEVATDTGPGQLEQVDFELLRSAPGGAWAVATTGEIAWLADGAARYAWPPVRNLETLDLAAPDLLWAAGQVVSDGFVGRVDGVWRTADGPDEGATVWDLDLVDSADGWGVSYAHAESSTELWRWDGQDWLAWPADKTWGLSQVQMLAGDEGWLGGGNTIARWRGESWQPLPGVPLGASGALGLLRGGESPWGWFGGIGAMFGLDGETWTTVHLPVLEEVVAVEMLAEDLGWALTPTSLYRYDGADWRPVAVPRPAGARFRDLDAVGSGQVWLLLDPPGLLHWTALRWQAHALTPLGGSASFSRLRACPLDPGPDCAELWLAGAPPAIARYRVLDAVSRLALPLALAP